LSNVRDQSEIIQSTIYGRSNEVGEISPSDPILRRVH
jgi:hypothetical protein